MAAHQIVAAADQACLVMSFSKRAGAAIDGIDIAHIAPPERLHRACQRARALRSQQQVYMVGHQHIGMHVAAFRAAIWRNSLR